jgi:beta-N-acetylhexosaminidase
VQGREIGASQAVLAALQAGCDMALLCNQSLVGKPGDSPLDTVLAELSLAQNAGSYQPEAASHTRRLALLPKVPGLAWEGMLQSLAYQRAVAVLP